MHVISNKIVGCLREFFNQQNSIRMLYIDVAQIEQNNSTNRITIRILHTLFVALNYDNINNYSYLIIIINIRVSLIIIIINIRVKFKNESLYLF